MSKQYASISLLGNGELFLELTVEEVSEMALAINIKGRS